MTLTISSDARWGTEAPAHERAHPAPTTTNAPTDHRLRRRLGRKCASVLAGASMGLGLTAARIPAASAQVGIAKPAVDHPAVDHLPIDHLAADDPGADDPAVDDPVADDPQLGQSP